MAQFIEIVLRADLPDGDEELGHDAMVQTREPAGAIVDLLTKIGLANATQTRRIGSTKVRRPKAPVVALATEAAEAAE